MKKSVIYARVSTEGQEEQKTIESQLAELRLFAKNNQYEIIDEYVDNGWSGGSLARPELDRLRDDIRNGGNFQVVLIHHPDRLARKYISQGLVMEELKKRGIEVIFLNRPNATDSLEDKLLLGVEGLFAEYEKEKILERTRRGKLHKAKSGFIVTGIAPFGYTYIKKSDNGQGYLEINLAESEVVRLIFDLFTKDLLSVRGINRELLKRKILPRGGSNKWSQSTLHRILRNEAYVGTAYYNKHYSLESSNKEKKYKRTIKSNKKLRDRSEWIPIQIIPIVGKDIFQRAQELLKLNSRDFGKTKHSYLLSGLVKCEKCGSTYSGEKSHGSLFYRCNNRHRTFPLPRGCDQKMISAPRLENSIWGAINEQILNPKIIARYMEYLVNNEDRKGKDILRSIEAIQGRLNDTISKRQRVIDIYADGLISKDDFIIKTSDLERRENEFSSKLTELNSTLLNIENKPLIKKGLEYSCKLIKEGINNLNFEARKHVLRHLVNELVFCGDRVIIRGALPIIEVKDKTFLQQRVGIMSPMY